MIDLLKISDTRIKHRKNTDKEGLRLLYDLIINAGGQEINGYIPLPGSVGLGYVKSFELEKGLKASVHQVTLNDDLLLKRNATPNDSETLFIAFNVFNKSADTYRKAISSVQITSNNINFTNFLPGRIPVFTLAISLEKSLLVNWFKDLKEEVPQLLTTNRPVVLDTPLTPEIRRLLTDFVLPGKNPFLPAFFYKIKIQELLYWLFRELNTWRKPVHFLHGSDVEKIYRVRDLLLSLPEKLPDLRGLSQEVNISEAKLKIVFKQIFGTSTYAFYQLARMEEAARLLLHHSVSEVGYQMGFSNLSHFARLFRKHHGITPKKFQSVKIETA